jgi:serine/threonine protein phosphatase PrpC
MHQHAVSSIVGRANEDRYTICTLNNNIDMFAIYDGHAGSIVADYIKDYLPEKLAKMLNNVDFTNEPLIKQIITDCFIALDKKMEELWQIFKAGCTATVCLIKDNLLYVSHLGDSRAIVFNQNLLFETIDHDGKNEDEVKRIENLGGYVNYGRVSGVIEVTRAFGDFSFKVAHDDLETYCSHGWISVIPDIQTLNVNNHILLIASDGLWNGQFKNSKEVITLYHSLNGNLQTICEQIVTKGYDQYQGIKDDITVILVQF